MSSTVSLCLEATVADDWGTVDEWYSQVLVTLLASSEQCNVMIITLYSSIYNNVMGMTLS